MCNILVNSLRVRGTTFFPPLDTSNICTRDDIFEILDENVVRVITEHCNLYESQRNVNGEKEKNILDPMYCTFIDLLLEDFENKINVHHVTIRKGRNITAFICSRATIFSTWKH
ncbi:hypothetical protein Cni_G00419 [Canna indica]|uniref:Uncharacterized protein n=1 Tax=Canna indica TaxID=4628 RepID=A0AAQ3JL29_9LILI|nr:hypothetical protein Cni_G00419 [Canna indica]